MFSKSKPIDTKPHYGNCFIEFVKYKLCYKNTIKMIFIPPWKKNSGSWWCPHIMWHDLIDDNVYDFYTTSKFKHFWERYWYKGYLRIVPYSVYKKWALSN